MPPDVLVPPPEYSIALNAAFTSSLFEYVESLNNIEALFEYKIPPTLVFSGEISSISTN